MHRMRTESCVFLALTLALVVAACTRPENRSDSKEAWDLPNAPENLGAISAKPYDQYELEAELPEDQLPWSDNYWPTYKGGISHRWRTSVYGYEYTDYQYEVLAPNAAEALTEEEIALLSPSEKYDIYTGNLRFPLTAAIKRLVEASVVDGEVASWYGICHGWAAAAMSIPEPGAMARVTSPRGQVVTFFASDIKALISESFARAQLRSKFLGRRCNEKDVARDDHGRALNIECRDSNPASFHIALAHLISEERKSFVAEMAVDAQVWNQPVRGYRMQYSNFRPLDETDAKRPWRAANAKYLVDVETVLEYVGGGSPSEAPTGSLRREKYYTYSLELDAEKLIVGGEWEGTEVPDFLWMPTVLPRGPFGPIDYAVVESLHAESLRPQLQPEPEPEPVPESESEPAPEPVIIDNPVMLSDVVLPSQVNVGSPLLATLRFRNNSERALPELPFKLQVRPGLLTLVEQGELRIPGMAPWSEVEVSVALKPEIWAGSNQKITFDIAIDGTDDLRPVMLNLERSLRAQRSSSLFLCRNGDCNQEFSGAMSAVSGRMVHVPVLFKYQATTALPGHFTVRFAGGSHQGIKVRANTMLSTNLGSWNPQYGDRKLDFYIDVPMGLAGQAGWVQFSLFEGNQEIHRLYVPLEIN